MNAAHLVILGASGDLTGRYLLRALAELIAADLLPRSLQLLGIARDDWDDTTFRRFAEERLALHAPELSVRVRDDLVGRLRFRQGDVTDEGIVAAAVPDAEGPVVVYLALPPPLFTPAIAALAAGGLPAGSRVIVEKPFGTDLASARHLNSCLRQHFTEDAVFRIDHFLGKQSVQNVLGLRFANRLFEPLWCAEHIEAVEIVWDETVALEGRAGYYDHAGALRDMIQNHLLQVLTFIAMDRPSGLEAKPLRDSKVAILRNVATPDENTVRRTTRARYAAGVVAGRAVPDYPAEPGVDPRRGTETFAEVVLAVDTDRWRGVPFRLRSGKALARDRREIRVRFRPVERLPFGQPDDIGPNVLTLALDPDRLTFDIALNGAGDPFRLEPARFDLDLAPQELSAYARLLVDAIEGDVALSTRGDEAEESWRIVEPILDAWERDVVPLQVYRAGSNGPV